MYLTRGGEKDAVELRDPESVGGEIAARIVRKRSI